MRPARVPAFAILVVLAVAFAACQRREEPAAPEATPAQEAPVDVPEPATEPITPEPATEPAPAEAAPAAEPAAPAETAAVAHAATIDFEIYKAGFIVGVSGGKGTLHYQGASHPLKIGGVSVGATAGISKAELTGTVQNLHRLSDIEGTYTAMQAGLTLGGGEKITQLENAKGVVLKVQGKQLGIELSLDLNGMQISLEK